MVKSFYAAIRAAVLARILAIVSALRSSTDAAIPISFARATTSFSSIFVSEDCVCARFLLRLSVLITAFLASGVIGLFEITLQQVVLLAVLMPVVASMGGISGSQTLTLIVRGLALGQITEANLKALLIKELKVGITNGIIWSLIIGTITYLWFGELGLSVVLGIAILGNLIAASASGVLIPSLLNKLKIDPALSGAVLLTTVTDVVGFLVFLGLGSLFLI